MLHDYKPDIVHTFFPAANIIGVLAARLAGVKNIVSSRRDYGEWMNHRYLLVTKFANRFVKRIIANSNQVREMTEEKEIVNNGKIEVIYNGIDLKLFKNIRRDYSFKKRLNIPENDRVVGIIANFKPVKNHYTFIKAAKKILSIKNDVSFLLIGGGEIKEEIERLGHSLNIAEKLYFTGRQKDIISYLSIIDVGVNCSKREGLSNAVIEYMAAGVPCVVSNVGGNPDLITNNVNGYLFKFDDHNELAALILKLLTDNDVRNKFITNARNKIEKEMGLETMLSNYQTFYQSLVNG
jgi:glycosyltransferase involved in cell wall biosynthesis